jgi:DNA-binding NtrC family response regulator
MKGKSDPVKTREVSKEDPFLMYHLPGAGLFSQNLRQRITTLNSSFNDRLLRVVLITGESGSGKNHVAEVIAAHRKWLIEANAKGRSPETSLAFYRERFAQIGVPTLPDQLLESELFGHKKGAFTDARENKKGLLSDLVDDVLLDEIGDASPVVQTKLLEVIETGRFRPVGASLEVTESTDVRFLLATHHDLGQLVERGKFREDLYWRSTEFVLRVPALREQPENVQGIIDYQLRLLYERALFDNKVESLRQRPVLTKVDLDWARSYEWPGNIRQLRHALVRWLAEAGKISLRDSASQGSLPSHVVRGPREGYRLIREGARQLIDGQWESEDAIAETPGTFITSVMRVAENEMVAWYDKTKPSGGQLERAFPKAKPSSVVNKMSQWRKRDER